MAKKKLSISSRQADSCSPRFLTVGQRPHRSSPRCRPVVLTPSSVLFNNVPQVLLSSEDMEENDDGDYKSGSGAGVSALAEAMPVVGRWCGGENDQRRQRVVGEMAARGRRDGNR